jgi:hypothetical protein
MSDPYKNVRGFLGSGSHAENAARSGAGLMSLLEAKRQGIDVSDLAESGTTDPDQAGVAKPKEQNTHMGIRMPGAAKPPVDVRPQTAYKDGQMVGVVTATITPKSEEEGEEKGALPKYEVTFSAQRTFPYGLKQTFNSEGEAKKFVANGETGKWFRPANPDPWESMTEAGREEAVRALIEGDKDKLERCIKGVKSSNVEAGRPAEGTDDDKGNPWGICKAQQKEGMTVSGGRIEEALGKSQGDR